MSITNRETNMRVIHVLHSHGVGGAERHAFWLLTALRDAGHEAIYAGPQDSWLAEHLSLEKIPVFHVPMHGFFDIFSMFKLGLLARYLRADLIHGHLTRGAHYAAIAARLSGCPAVATAHATNAAKHFGGVSKIIAVSSAVAEFLKDQAYPSDRIITILNAVPMPMIEKDSARKAMRKQLALHENEIAIGMVARFVADKGHDVLLNALSQLSIDPRAPQNWRLFFAGSYSTDWGRRMQALSVSLGLKGRVTFLGEIEDVQGFLPAMDILVAPSRRESFGLALVEGMAVGIPVISARVGGVPEVVEDGITGLLTPAEDVIALKLAIQQLLGDDALRQSMGQAGYLRFKAHFSLNRLCRDILALYDDVITEKRKGSPEEKE
jgi:glycosyltransferase involved in cell wall biosynthesis